MATITKVRRVANPRKRRRFSALRNKKGRFVKASRARNKRATPKRKHNSARRVVRKSKRRSNPVLIELMSLAGNPRKRRKTLAKRRYRKTRAANPRRRRTRRVNAAPRRRRRTAVARPVRRRRRRVNPVAAAPVRRRRRYSRRRRAVANPRRRYVRRRRMNGSRRRNPVFGMAGGKNMLIMVGGGLVGVAATKFLPTLVPSSITSTLGASPLVAIAITGAGAFAAGWLARRFVGQAFGDAVLFGGLMQTGSAILTAFAPTSLSSQLALSGVGDIVPGWFAVPQNPITNRAPQMMMAPSSGNSSGKSGVSGFGPGGFGYRRSR